MADAEPDRTAPRRPARRAPRRRAAAGAEPDRTLTTRELNRALLARQLLLERAPLEPAAALERLCGLQAQYAPAAYVGLWSRVAGLERDALTRAHAARAVVQATLLRATVHLAAPGDFWPFALAVREARRRLFLTSRRGALTAAQMAGAARVLRRRLADGPVHRREAEALVGRGRLEGVRLWVDLLRVPPAGTWERPRADLYALAEAELGPPAVTPARAVEHLVARYLRAFGPASRRDVASFCGLGAAELAPALRRVAPRRLRGPGGEELLDVADGLLPDPATPAPVRFLGVWDATLLVHARRTAVLPEPLRPRVFHTRNPHGTPTVLVDGAVAGSWRHAGGRIEVEPYGRLDAADARAVAQEAERLAAFHA